MTRELMIYGATGYTGRLLGRRAVEQGWRPILGGRSAEKLRPVAQELGVEYRSARVENVTQMAAALEGVKVLLNAAGPFSATARPALEACLRRGVHYVDIGGELPAFRALHAYDRAARARGILVLPGAGFLVTATDCLAAHVARQLPAAESLVIAVSRPDVLERGSRRTVVSLIEEQVQVRRGGRMVDVPVGVLTRRFDLGDGAVACSAISGAEIVATFLTTGIGNIEVYGPATASERALYRLGAMMAPMLRTRPSQLALRALADCWSLAKSRKNRRQVAVAIAADAAGARVARRLSTPDAYESTAMMALATVDRVLGMEECGFRTPGQLFGPELLFSLPGVLLEALKTDSVGCSMPPQKTPSR